MKKLVIAEKPSVAREYIKHLGLFNKFNGYSESDKYIVTWAFGHLVELCDPSYYSEKYKRWSLKDLPMQIDKLDQKLIEKTKEQALIIEKLLKRSDLESVVIATDAGREGELVARWILKIFNYNGKIERLWLSSQTEAAILNGFNNLEDGSKYDALFNAAEARSAADWFVGLNVSRALTCFYDARLSAGRVQTPTLALLCKKEDEIDEFLSSFYYTARGNFGLFSASFYPDKNSIRFNDEKTKGILETFENREAIVSSIINEEKEEKIPLAYDLTELQRDANIYLGFSAKETLDVLQRLYEVHKIVTYPRTDSRYITSDMASTIKQRLKALSNTKYSLISEEYLINGFMIDSERFVNDEGVTDHSAIIITEEKVDLSKLNDNEAKLFDLIVKRFLEVLSSSYKYLTSTYTLTLDNYEFKSKNIKVIQNGFKNVSKAFDLKIEDDNNFALCALKLNDKVTLKNVKIKKLLTKAPERYTDATLLSQMEHAGRYVEDVKLKVNLTKGLGTPATRAEIIEKLISSYYVERDGKFLVPTVKGRELIRLVPEVLSSAELTAKWEDRLENIAKGKEDTALFIKDIKDMAASLVQEVKTSDKVYTIKDKNAKMCPYCKTAMLKLLAKDNNIHYVCQKLSCSYEEMEVKTKINVPTSVNKSITSDGKIKIKLKSSIVPKTMYEVKTIVVNPSKFRQYKNVEKKEENITIADLLKQHGKNRERSAKRK